VVHASFDGAGAPVHGQAVGDGVEVLLQSFGERGDAGQAGVAGGGHPLREVLAGQLGDHDGEAANLVAGGLQFGAAVEDGLEQGLLVLGQGVGVAGEPVRDVADGRRAGGSGALAGLRPEV
jgi:hypothetical protein